MRSSDATLNEKNEIIELRSFGHQLWTRETAREVRVHVEDALSRLPVGGVCVIDASGVQVFDFSFANELFGKTILQLPTDHPGRFVVVEGLTPYTKENLEVALDHLGIAMIERRGRRIELLGRVHPIDRETIQALVAMKGSATPTDLKERLGISLTAANERLKKLEGTSLVRRERTVSSAGREQFVYRVLD